jgi:hypothetical protein
MKKLRLSLLFNFKYLRGKVKLNLKFKILKKISIRSSHLINLMKIVLRYLTINN